MIHDKLHDRSKIICTIGPASSSPEMLRGLAEAGMNVARLNFSHGTHEDKLRIIQSIRQVREETGKNIGILQDLSGPKIRTGNLPEEGVLLAEGDTVHLVPGDEYDHSPKNAKRIDLDHRQWVDGATGARRDQRGLNSKRKGFWSSWSGVAPNQGKPKTGN